jgi:ABC-type Na+ efflux pump permease subunit
MRFLRNIWTIAKAEFTRPMRSKTTSLSLATLLASLLLFHFAFPSASYTAGISDSASSRGLYSASANDSGLADIIVSSQKFRLTEAAEADLVLSARDGKVAARGPLTPKGNIALNELSFILRDGDKRLRESLALADHNLTYVLHPLWVSEKNSTLQPAAYLTGQSEAPAAASGADDAPPADAVSPESLETPIPMSPLVRYFLVFVPILFFSLYFASTILREKVDRRGTYLLSTPMTAWEAVTGKALPFLTAITIIHAGIGWLIGAPIIPLLAAFTPIAVLCLGIALIVACLSNSPHDLNVTLTFAYMLVFAYVFYPAMFTGLSKAALASPLGALIEYIDGNITAETYTLLLLPLALSALVIWVGGVSLFQDEVLFSHDATLYKLYRAFDPFLMERIQPYGLWVGLLLGGVILAPLVYMAEVYLLFLLLPFGWHFMYLLVPLAALLEETAKVFTLAAFTKAGKLKGGMLQGALAGFGFYAAERLLLAGILAGLLSTQANLYIAAASLLITMAVHVACSAIAGRGLRASAGRMEGAYVPYLLAAVIIHSAYNLYVMGAI